MKRIGIIAVLVVVVLAGSGCTKYPPRQALPMSATEIHEFNWDAPGFSVDYFYALKATISPDDFVAYCHALGLKPYNPKSVQSGGNISWCGLSNYIDDWWSVSQSLTNTFIDPSCTGSKVVMAKYEAGCVYYRETVGF